MVLLIGIFLFVPLIHVLQPARVPTTITGTVLEDAQGHAEVFGPDDPRIADVAAIQDIIDRAREAEPGTAVHIEGSTENRSRSEMREAKAAIDTLNDETGGSYVRVLDRIVELGYSVPD